MSKIAVIHSIYKPFTRGGAEVVVENIVQGLRDIGHEVFVISVGRRNEVNFVSASSNVIPAPEPGSNEVNEKLDPASQPKAGTAGCGMTKKDNSKIKVYRIKPFNLFNFLDINQKPVWLRFFWHLVDMLNVVQAVRIYQILKKEKPAVVLSHNLKGLGYLTLTAVRALGVKNIHTVHDAQLLHPSGLVNQEAALGRVASVYARFCRWLFGSPQTVIFPSRYIKSIYEKWGFFKGSERVVLGNPIIIKSPRYHPPGAELRGKQNQKNNFNILFLGQVEEYKGIFELIEVFQKLPITNYQLPVTLNIVGNGSALEKAKILVTSSFRAESGRSDVVEESLKPSDLSTRLDASVEMTVNNVVFHGRMTHEELAEKIWPITDLLINPTKVPESFGMVVLEAFSYGVPVIASNIGALPELVEENQTRPSPSTFAEAMVDKMATAGETGWLVKPGDTKDLKDKLEHILSHPEILENIKENCRKKTTEFDLNDYLTKLLVFAKLER